MDSRQQITQLQEKIAQSIIGQEIVVERLLVALLANGNVLMEGLPGLAKTRAIKTLSKHVESDFRRIQFTPDLLPSDVTGTEVYFSEEGSGKFLFQPGPIFGHLILADEINRAPAKVQAALLEAMEERQVTVASKTHMLPELFMVLATQNPVEQEGTYPLPEAQMDRFLMHVFIHHPTVTRVNWLSCGWCAKKKALKVRRHRPHPWRKMSSSRRVKRCVRSRRPKQSSDIWWISSAQRAIHLAITTNWLRGFTWALVPAARLHWIVLRGPMLGCKDAIMYYRMMFARLFTIVYAIVLCLATRRVQKEYPPIR